MRGAAGGSTKKRRPYLKWIALGSVAILVLSVVAALVALSSIDPRQYGNMAIAAVKQSTGRDLKVNGAMDLRISLAPEVTLDDVSFANAPWATRSEMIRLRRAELKIALAPLFLGEVRISRLTLVEPEVLLEVDENGRGNWDFKEDRESRPTQPKRVAGAPSLKLHEVTLENGRLIYHDWKAGKRTQLALAHANLHRPHALSRRLQVVIAGTLDRKPFQLDGTMGPLQAILGNNSWPVDLTGRINGAIVKVKGDIGRPLDLEDLDLVVDADIGSLSDAGRFVGASLPKLPSFRLQAEVRDSGNVREIDPLRVKMGESELAGDVRIEREGKRRQITAKLAGPLLDLSEVPRKTETAPPPQGDGRVFSREPLPFQMLGNIDAEGELTAEKVLLPGRDRLEAFRVKASLHGGRLRLDPVGFSTRGGQMKADLDLDGSSGKEGQLRLSVVGSGIPAGALFSLAGFPQPMSGGRTELRINAFGSGATMQQLMASLRGHAWINMGPARLEGRGLDLGADVFTEMANVLNPTRQTDPAMQFECFVLNVPVRNGIVNFDGRAGLETTKVRMSAEGTVDLGNEALDLAVRSKAKEGIGVGLANFAGAARIQGSFANPQIGVDAQGAAGIAATAGAAVFTGGLSLIGQSLFDKAFPEYPCKQALAAGKAAPKKSAAPREKKEPGFFERLFGR